MPVAATIISARGRRAPVPPTPPPSFNFDFFVSPSGGTGAGTIGDPWSLTYALSGAGGAIVPGKKIALRAGTYDAGASGNWSFGSAVSGTVGISVDDIGNKVVFRNYNNEVVKLINTSAGSADVVKLNCDYLWLWGAEIYDNGWTNRNIATQTNGCVDIGNPFGNGCKLIHCIIHDGEQCVENLTGAVGSDKFEMYGCILYNAGVDQSPLGHNFYVHHTGSTTARFVIEESVIFSSFGLLCQIYGNSDHVDWFDLIGNILFNGGALSASQPYSSQMVLMGGGGQPPTNCRYINNMLFGSDSNTRTLEVGFSAGNVNNVEIGNNYHVGGGSGTASFDINRPVSPQSSLNVHDNFWKVADANSVVAFNDAGAVTYTWANNEWHHVSTSGFGGASFSSWKTTTTLGGTDTQIDAAPSTTKVFVRNTNRYETGRGHVCFFNWGSLSNVPVDLSTILNNGDTYAIYDVRDLVTAILTGTYSGGTINFPTTQKPDIAPIGGFVGGIDPVDTVPFFNAFLVRKT
jgi:hypothetical protein